jgi:hypothetical protein
MQSVIVTATKPSLIGNRLTVAFAASILWAKYS